MKISSLNQISAALLAIAFSGSMANAATYVHTELIQPFNLTGLGAEDAYFQWQHLGDSFPGAKLGDTIVEDIIFVTMPGYSTFQVSALSDMYGIYYEPGDPAPYKWAQEVEMMSMKLYEMPVASDALPVGSFSTIIDPTFASGTTPTPINSGAYYIELTALVIGGDQTPSFTGTITDTPAPFPSGGSVTAVPEPATAWLMALGLAGVGYARRQKRRTRDVAGD